MAFVLLLAGLLMIVTGAKGTYLQFGQQLRGDVNGQFIYFAAAIAFVGALGYVDALRTFSRLFMALILIVLVLANKGFASKFTAALKAGPQAPAAVPSAGNPWPTGSASSTTNADGSQPNSGTQAKANQYFNAFKNFFSSGGQ